MIGIYCILNRLNGKRYYGQSLNLEYRMSFLERNSHLNSSLEKYRRDNFEIFVVEECTIDELDERERFYISRDDTMDPSLGYNKTSGGNLNKVFSEETLRKMSDVRIGVPHPRSGAKSLETRILQGKLLRSYQETEKYSKARSESMKRAWKDPDYREKMSKSQRGPRGSNPKLSEKMKGNQRCLGKKNVHRFVGDVKEVKKIDSSEYESYISSGWLPGMGPRR